MMSWLIFFSTLATANIRCMVCLILISRLLSSKPPGRKSILAVLFGTAVISVILSMAGLPAFYCTAAEACFIAFCASRFQMAGTRMSLFVGIYYEIAFSFWQFLLAGWMGVLFRTPEFLDSQTGRGQIAVWLPHLLLIALAWYPWGHKKPNSKEAFRFASVVAVAGIIAVATLAEQTVLTIDGDLLDTWTILAVVLLMSVLVFNINRQYEVEKELAKLKSEQAELLERDYTTLNNAYAINAKLFHDFHNHIGVLRQLLLHRNTKEALQYLDELQTPMQAITDTVWTGDNTVDYLINSKAEAARESGVKYQVQAEFPRHTNLRSADLCAILGNLLDNALDAARRVQASDQPYIKLTIRRINQMLVIKVENRFAVAPTEENGTLKTIKEENGLQKKKKKSAQTTAEKYDGMVQTSYTGNTFCAVATLSFQGVPCT